MRIVGGKYRGLRLATPKDDRIRPTSDRVRESLFNILGHMDGFIFDGASVFDAFCGTGALGIEALSRGAHSCIFADTSKTSLDLCRKNCARVEDETSLIFINANAEKAAASDKIAENSLSLIFLDPPYGKGLAAPVLEKLHSCQKLAEDCIIVIEMSKKQPENSLHTPFHLLQERAYGTTVIRIYQYRKK